MKSKEAVKLARIEFEKDLEYDENNQWLKNIIPVLEQAEKDLEVLEILKDSITDKEAHMIVMKDEITEKMKGEEFMILHYTIKGTEKVDKIKEWLNGR